MITRVGQLIKLTELDNLVKWENLRWHQESKINRTYNYASERNWTDLIKIFTSLKGTEKVVEDRNYSIRKEGISVHSRAERENIFVENIFLYDARVYTNFWLAKIVLE